MFQGSTKSSNIKFSHFLPVKIRLRGLIPVKKFIYRKKRYLIHFKSMFHSIPLENVRKSLVFRKYRNEALAKNRLIILLCTEAYLGPCQTCTWNVSAKTVLCEKCSNSEIFLVCIFLYSDQIRRFTP